MNSNGFLNIRFDNEQFITIHDVDATTAYDFMLWMNNDNIDGCELGVAADEENMDKRFLCVNARRALTMEWLPY